MGARAELHGEGPEVSHTPAGALQPRRRARLDLPVPQTVDNVTDALRILDRPMAEQVIEVPKISCSPCLCSSPIPEPQSAEQLLSPTRIALEIAEQIVGRLLWNAFLSGLWSRTLTFLLVLTLDRGLLHLLVLQMRILLGFFTLLPMEKSAECRAGGECAAG